MDLATIDYIVIAAVLLFSFLGMITGFLAQVFGLAALAGAWVLSAPAGQVVGNFIAAHSETPPSSAYVIGRFTAGVLIYTGLRAIFFTVNRYLGRRKEGALGSANRVLGGTFAGLKAFALAWLVLCLVAAFPSYFQNLKPNIHSMLKDSKMGKLIEHYNPVKESRLVGGAQSLAEIIKNDPQALEKLQSDPDVARFLSVVKRKLAEQAKDPETQQQIRQGDLSLLKNWRTAIGLLRDPEVREAFEQIDLRETLYEAARQARQNNKQ